MDVRVKRVYEPAEAGDCYRVLVDRVWPRGVAKERAAIDEWARELAPSTELRRWFGHRPERFARFRERYLQELEERREELDRLRDRAQRGTVTLVYSARDEDHNQARVLAEALHTPPTPRG